MAHSPAAPTYHAREIAMRLVAIVLAVAMGFASLPARPSTQSSEITDMWWNPAESGWGVNVILQRDVAFLTFFLYDQAHAPVWYTAQLQYQGANASGASMWSGQLYATTGPWYGGAFPSSQVSLRQAGAASFTLSTLNQAALSYTVDGVTVTKVVQRQTWTNENYSGTYAGGYSVRLSCVPSSLNGVEEVAGLLSVSHNGTSIAISAVAASGSCSFAGTYTQTGKMGGVVGTYTCVNGTRGTFQISEMTPTLSGFTARVSGNNQLCQWSGSLGGISRAH
jgi:hypothetical protein